MITKAGRMQLKTAALVFIASSIVTGTAFDAQASSTKKAGGEAAAVEKDKESWDVNNPPGEKKEIRIKTTTSTWSNVDVSPDGKSILFDVLGDIYLLPIKGGKAKPLTSGMAWDMQARFSPDGKEIAFISDREGGDNLWVMSADGSNPRSISQEKENHVHSPNWSPDGDYIAVNKGFTGARSIAGGEVWLYHKLGGSGYQLIERIGGAQAQKSIGEPSFSHDGRYVYYSKDSTPGTVWQYNKNPTTQIFTIQRLDRLTGKDITFVGGPGGAIAPTPSSDGKYLAYIKRVNEKTVLFVKDLKSGVDKALYRELDRDLQETNGMHGNAPQFAWTPDNKSLVFWAGGKLRRAYLNSAKDEQIAFEVDVKKSITPALRFAVDVAPDNFDVKMIRWAHKSPQGDKAVFQALGKIYVYDIRSGERRRLTRQDDHFEFYPRFSLDGKSIVYVTWDDEKLGTVRVVSSRGGNGKVITTEPGHYVEPAFSNDGKQVVFRRFTGGYLTSSEYSMEPGLYVASARGKSMRRIHDTGMNPQFSADGKRVFYSEYGENATVKLLSIDLNGEDQRVHYTGKDITEFSISPNNKWLAFTQQFNAYVAPFIETGQTQDISKDNQAIKIKQVSTRSGEYLNWSAKSDALNWALGAKLYERRLDEAFKEDEDKKGKTDENKGIELSFPQKADKPTGTIALVGGTVVTMRDANKTQEIIKDGVVIVAGNRISAVGAKKDIKIPSGAKVIDMSGKTILPGMVDVHAHGAQASNEINPEQNWQSFSSLAFGVTTIHDPSNDTTEIFSASELQKAGITKGPRIFSTGTILYGAKAPGYTASINSFEDAKFHLKRLKELGAITVKSYQQPRRDQKQQVVAAGKELGVMVVPEGGAKFYHNMTMIVDGHTGIEHALPLAKVYDDVKQLWSQTEVGYSPTFGVAYGGLSGETYWYDKTQVWKNDLLMRYTPAYLVEPQAIRRMTAPESHYNHFEVAKTAKALNEQGVAVVIGAHGQREGLAAHWEVWMMEQGGFTPWEALRGATIDGARYLGMDKHIGSIEENKLADLMIIDGDVLSDIRQSQNVAYAMVNGRLFESRTMNEVGRKNGFERKPFFFERLSMQALPVSTAKAIEAKQKQFHWRH